MPRVKLSRTARVVLYFMQFYIVLMFLLIVLKFVQTFHQNEKAPTPPAPIESTQKGE